MRVGVGEGGDASGWKWMRVGMDEEVGWGVDEGGSG